MKLFKWYVLDLERGYPVSFKNNRVKYISYLSWTSAATPLSITKITDVDKRVWDRFNPYDAEIIYSHDCVKAIFR